MNLFQIVMLWVLYHRLRSREPNSVRYLLYECELSQEEELNNPLEVFRMFNMYNESSLATPSTKKSGRTARRVLAVLEFASESECPHR